jgi:pimeloyl-ACP methyl ester carboxylesterase
MTITDAPPYGSKVQLASGIVVDLLSKGSGPPLLFLHSAFGRTWPVFLDELAQHFTVYAPMSPGGEEPEELMLFDGFNDLALFYDDLLNALEVTQAVVVGHSFGGMAAAEFAAYFPHRVSRLILINALGLWLDEAPVADIHTVPMPGWPDLLFVDPKGATAKEVLQPPSPDKFMEFMLHAQLGLASAVHFYWPIPDRDLKRRLYRITSPTLLVWGAKDKVVPRAYVQAFESGIAGKATTSLIDDAGHFPHIERSTAVVSEIMSFVDNRAAVVA